MWGTDTTTTSTTDQGTVHVFAAADHCTCECIGLHAAERGDRFEAPEPPRQGVREHFGGFERGIARGLAIRHDHGGAYTSDDPRAGAGVPRDGRLAELRAGARGERLCRAVHPHPQEHLVGARSSAAQGKRI